MADIGTARSALQTLLVRGLEKTSGLHLGLGLAVRGKVGYLSIEVRRECSTVWKRVQPCVPKRYHLNLFRQIHLRTQRTDDAAEL